MSKKEFIILVVITLSLLGLLGLFVFFYTNSLISVIIVAIAFGVVACILSMGLIKINFSYEDIKILIFALGVGFFILNLYSSDSFDSSHTNLLIVIFGFDILIMNIWIKPKTSRKKAILERKIELYNSQFSDAQKYKRIEFEKDFFEKYSNWFQSLLRLYVYSLSIFPICIYEVFSKEINEINFFKENIRGNTCMLIAIIVCILDSIILFCFPENKILNRLYKTRSDKAKKLELTFEISFKDEEKKYISKYTFDELAILENKK